MKSEVEKTKKWREIVTSYEKSGLTLRKFCIKAELNVPQLNYWRRKFNLVQPRIEKTVPFIRVINVAESTNETNALSIEVGRIKINIPADFNPDHLKRLLSVVRSID